MEADTREAQERVEQLQERFRPAFERAMQEAVRVYGEARVGHLIDDTEEPWAEVLQTLAQQIQEQGLQGRVEEVEADFSPSGQGNGSA